MDAPTTPVAGALIALLVLIAAFVADRRFRARRGGPGGS